MAEHRANDGKPDGEQDDKPADGHLSWQAYVESMAPLQGYSLQAAQTERVIAQLELIAQVVSPLLDIALSFEVEPAAVFRP